MNSASPSEEISFILLLVALGSRLRWTLTCNSAFSDTLRFLGPMTFLPPTIFIPRSTVPLYSYKQPRSPLDEQTEIVTEVERRVSAADRLATTLDQQLVNARATRQSLLSDAFARRLVPA